MKKHILAAVIALVATGASAQVSYPGNVWGTLVHSADAPGGYPKYRVEGVVEQGVVWRQFNDWKLNTYGGFEYVLNSDSKGVTPMLGVKLQKSFGGDGALDLGVRVKHGNTYLSPSGGSVGGTNRVTRTEIFATYWFAWDLRGK